MQSEQNDPLQEGPLQEVPVDSCSTLPIPSLAEHLERKSNPGQDRFRLASMQLFKFHGLRKRLHPSAQVDFFRPVWAKLWGYLTYAVEDCGGLLFPATVHFARSRQERTRIGSVSAKIAISASAEPIAVACVAQHLSPTRFHLQTAAPTAKGNLGPLTGSSR